MSDQGLSEVSFNRAILAFHQFSDLVFFVDVFFRYIVFRKLRGAHLTLVGIACVFYAADGLGFHVLAFFHQLFNAFGIVKFAA